MNAARHARQEGVEHRSRIRGATLFGRAWATALALTLPFAAPQAAADAPGAARQQQLLRMVRQDCGACHGMQLTGGLGPDITAAALADRGYDMVFATIWFGRQGTPMPPWRGLLNEAEVRWMAQRLMHGLQAGEGR